MLWFVKSLPVQSFLCLAGDVVGGRGMPSFAWLLCSRGFCGHIPVGSVEHFLMGFPDVPRAHASLTSPLVTSSALLSTHLIFDDAIVEAL